MSYGKASNHLNGNGVGERVFPKMQSMAVGS